MSSGRFIAGTHRWVRAWRNNPLNTSHGPGGGRANRHISQIRAEQTRLLFDNLPPALIATGIVGALVAYVLWDHVPHEWLIAWGCTLAAITFGRISLRRAYFKARPSIGEAPRWAHRFLIGVALSGAVWGIAGVFPLPPEAGIQQMFAAFVLAGLAAGSMTTLSSYRGAYAAFLVPAILPYTFKLMLQQGEVSMTMSAMLILFIVMMSLISSRHYRSVAASLRLRFDKLDLLEDLAAARDHQQAINQALQAQIDERKRTDAALKA